MPYPMLLGALAATHATPAARSRICATGARSRVVAAAGGGGGLWEDVAAAWSAFGKRVDAEIDEFTFAKRDRQWNPDRRTEEERNKPFDMSASTLSWGGMQPDSWTVFATTVLKDEELAKDAVITSALGDEELALLGLKQAINSAVGSAPSADIETPMSGRELAELCFTKYSRYHDIALLTTSPFGKSNRQVAVNMYGPSLGFGGAFKLTEEQYLAKLDTIADALNDWGQAQFVRDFYLSPITPRRGLPSRPRADSAVTLRLNTSPTWSQVPPEDVDAYWQFL
ncbi:hypothetical protein T492DRAFT_1018845 [Pavlovales sp. CCMP2436]|nr:hypothetical protein T492DRAFT_1018845 [Pavlovales sp. CCMP2436]